MLSGEIPHQPRHAPRRAAPEGGACAQVPRAPQDAATGRSAIVQKPCQGRNREKRGPGWRKSTVFRAFRRRRLLPTRPFLWTTVQRIGLQSNPRFSRPSVPTMEINRVSFACTQCTHPLGAPKIPCFQAPSGKSTDWTVVQRAQILPPQAFQDSTHTNPQIRRNEDIQPCESCYPTTIGNNRASNNRQ